MAKVLLGNVRPDIDYLKTIFAPAGYGLGHAKTLTSKDNLGTIKENGWYHWFENDVPAGVPELPNTTYMRMMRVWANDGGVCCQEIMDMSDSVRKGSVIRRIIYGSTVYEWEWENPLMMVGVEYRTTERWDGKPVYAALVNVGVFPESGMRNAPTGITATGVIRFHAAFGYTTLPLAGNMEINTFHDGEEITVQLNTIGERIYSNDTYVTLYYIKN